MQASRGAMQAEVSGGTALNGATTHMPVKRYRAIRKRDRRGADVWGVAAFEAHPGAPWRQIAWKTVGRDEQGELEARALAAEMERRRRNTVSASSRGTAPGNVFRSTRRGATTCTTTAR